MVWDAATGEPITDAIVWQDTRTQPIVDALAAAHPLGTERLREITGLPLASYFSAGEVGGGVAEIPGARERAERGELRFGTIDSWLVYPLTGGANGGLHVTDVTNASRTQLCDLGTLDWSDEALEAFGVPRSMLPRIVSSSGAIGEVRGIPGLEGVPISGILGDQQAATFGQAAFAPGDAKHTYGTGGFLIVNTGERPVLSRNGLLTTVAYRIGDAAPVYALEGSVAVAGSLHHWLRDNLGLMRDSTEIEGLASSEPDTGGALIVPAFSGLFAPRWQPDARGVIVGLTRYVNRAHIVRAALESICYQTREVLDAMEADSGVALTSLRVDGGATANNFLMQLQADILGAEVIRPKVAETTSLGAAYAAGLAVGFWDTLDDLRANWQVDRTWSPQVDAAARATGFAGWKKAVTRTFDWVET